MRGGPGTAGDLETTFASENSKIEKQKIFVQSRQEPTLGKTAGMGLRIRRLEERIPHNGGQRGRNKKKRGGPGTAGDLEITFANENSKIEKQK